MTRAHWSNQFAFILVAAGSAIGLGNIWKFPYMAGVNGGGAFVLVYLFCIFFVGFPIFISELYIGNKAQSDPETSFEVLHKKKSAWRSIGWLGGLASFLVLGIYSNVGAWVLDYLYLSLTNHFSGTSSEIIKGYFPDLITNNESRVLLWHSVFMGLTVAIVICGIQKGIETFVRFSMPALGLILVGLLFWCSYLDGFNEALRFLFVPDFSKLTPKAVLEALGHAFFSLSLGMAAMIAYGSYLSQRENLVKISTIVILLDTAFALLAGVVVFSIVFTFDEQASSGPGLLFVTLPQLLSQIPGAYYVSILFFLLVTFAALTSSISLLEIVVSLVSGRLKITRKAATLSCGFAIYILGVLSVFSFKTLSHWTLFDLSMFDAVDKFTSKILLPVGGLLTVTFFGWILKKENHEEAAFSIRNTVLFPTFLFFTRYVAPTGILIILVYGFVFP